MTLSVISKSKIAGKVENKYKKTFSTSSPRHKPAIATARGYSHRVSSGVQPPSHLLGGSTGISPSRGHNRHLTFSGVRGIRYLTFTADDSPITSARGYGRYKSHLHGADESPLLTPCTSPNGAPKQGASRVPMTSVRHLMTSDDDVTFSRTLLAAILDLGARPG